jgi:hypothetical protein
MDADGRGFSEGELDGPRRICEASNYKKCQTGCSALAVAFGEMGKDEGMV